MPPDNDSPPLDPATVAAYAGGHRGHPNAAAVPPIEPATTFVRNADYDLPGGYSYSRSGHPTVSILESAAARLDAGIAARAFNSGMAAISAVVSTVPFGAHVVAPRVMYHGAQDLLVDKSRRGEIEVEFFEGADPAGIEKAIRPDTDLEAYWAEKNAESIDALPALTDQD